MPHAYFVSSINKPAPRYAIATDTVGLHMPFFDNHDDLIEAQHGAPAGFYRQPVYVMPTTTTVAESHYKDSELTTRDFYTEEFENHVHACFINVPIGHSVSSPGSGENIYLSPAPTKGTEDQRDADLLSDKIQDKLKLEFVQLQIFSIVDDYFEALTRVQKINFDGVESEVHTAVLTYLKNQLDHSKG